jgi:polyhydroxyalkanoate synthesis regulator phasin
MMISMVQSVDMQTKLLCVIALNNLLDENTVDYMISEGIVGSIANLSKLSRNYPRTANLICDDTIKYMEVNGYIGSITAIQHLSNKIYQPNPESALSLLISLRGITRLCAGILNQLTLYPEARMKMVDKFIAMGTLSAMSGSELIQDIVDEDQPKSSDTFGEQMTESMSIQMTISPESFILCVRTAANLVLCDHCRTKAIDSGALRVLEKGSLYIADEASSLHCIKALFSACSSDSQFLVAIANSTLPLALVTVAMSCTGEKHDYAVKSLNLISWLPEARIFLQKENFLSLFMSLILKKLANIFY